MPPTVLGEMIRENVERLQRSASAAGNVEELLDIIRATRVMARDVEETWDVLNESLDEGVEEGVFADRVRKFLGSLRAYQAVCHFVHATVAPRGDIPDKDRWLERLAGYRQRAEQIRVAGETLLTDIEVPEPAFDPAALVELERRCDKAGAWIAGEDLLAELRKGENP